MRDGFMNEMLGWEKGDFYSALGMDWWTNTYRTLKRLDHVSLDVILV
jgi:hypothetical protein